MSSSAEADGKDLVEPECAIGGLQKAGNGDIAQQQCDHQPGVPRHVCMGTFE